MVNRTFSIPICWVLPVAAILVRDCVALPEPVAVAANASAAIATRAVTVAKYLRDMLSPLPRVRAARTRLQIRKTSLRMPRGPALLDEGAQAFLPLLTRAALGDAPLGSEPVGALEDKLLGMARGFG